MASIRSVWKNGGTMGSQWGEEYPGSMRSMERGNKLYKIRGREIGSMRSMEVRSVGRFYILYEQSPFNGLSS